jgi:hypothetical protein
MRKAFSIHGLHHAREKAGDIVIGERPMDRFQLAMQGGGGVTFDAIRWSLVSADIKKYARSRNRGSWKIDC